MFYDCLAFADANKGMAALAAPPVDMKIAIRPPSVAPRASDEFAAVHGFDYSAVAGAAGGLGFAPDPPRLA